MSDDYDRPPPLLQPATKLAIAGLGVLFLLVIVGIIVMVASQTNGGTPTKAKKPARTVPTEETVSLPSTLPRSESDSKGVPEAFSLSSV